MSENMNGKRPLDRRLEPPNEWPEIAESRPTTNNVASPPVRTAWATR